MIEKAGTMLVGPEDPKAVQVKEKSQTGKFCPPQTMMNAPKALQIEAFNDKSDWIGPLAFCPKVATCH